MASVYFAISTVVSFLLCYGVMLLEQYILYIIIVMLLMIIAMVIASVIQNKKVKSDENQNIEDRKLRKEEV